jgi:hypothetical protein
MNNHPLFGTRYFKYHYHIFSIKRAKPDEWWLYARQEAREEVYFLGKVLKERVQISEMKLEWAISRGRDKLFEIAVEQFKVYEQMERVVTTLEKRSYLCDNTQSMAKPEKIDRNRKLVEYIESCKKRGEKVSYSLAARMFGLKAKSTVANIYNRDKLKYSPVDKSVAPFVLKKYTRTNTVKTDSLKS